MSMWEVLGPLGTGIVVFLYMIKYYFLNKSLEEKERTRKVKPYVSMRQRKIDAKMERRKKKMKLIKMISGGSLHKTKTLQDQ